MSKIIKLSNRSTKKRKTANTDGYNASSFYKPAGHQSICIPSSYRFPLDVEKVVIEKVGDELRIRPWDGKFG